MRRILIVLLALVALPAAAYGHPFAAKPPVSEAAPPTGTLSVCNTSGARPVTGLFAYTLAASAAAGGTQTFNIAVGSCSPQVFYPQGTQVIVSENVPTGYAVTSISVSGGGTTILSNIPSAGTATVTIGSGQSLLTFETSGSATKPLPDCRIPNVAGLTLAGAKALIVKSHCKLGVVRRAYSAVFNAGRVVGSKPHRGIVLANGAPVDVTVSRGPKP